MSKFVWTFLVSLPLSLPVWAGVNGQVLGSFAGGQEECIAIDEMPGGKYSRSDKEKEAKYCT